MISNTSKSITLNTFYQLAAKLITMSITVGITVLVTRWYGREAYGEFSLMQNFPALFFVIVDFGINAVVVREISKDFSKAEKYLGNVLVIRMLMFALLMITSLVILLFLPYSPALRLGISLSLFLILTQALYATTNIIFQPKLRYDLSSIGLVAGGLTVLLVSVILAYFRVPVMWISFSYVISGLVTYFVNKHLINKLGIRIKPQFDKNLVKIILLQSLPLGLMFIFSQVNFKIDSIFMSFLKMPTWLGLSNTEAVAVYSLPYKVFEVSLVVPTFFMNAVYPVLVAHMMESQKRLSETFIKVMLALSAVGVLVGLISVAAAPFVMRILGGEGFERSVFVLRVLMGSSVVFYLTQPISWLIVTLEGQKHLPIIYLISALFNVSANLIFIPKHAFYASSVITVMSELLIFLMLVVAATKIWKQRYA